MDKLIWWGGLTSPLSRNSSLTNALQCQIAMHLLIHSSKLSSHHLVHHHHHHHQDQWHVNEALVSSEWLTGCQLPGWVMVATRNWAYCTFVHHFQLLGILYNVKPFQLLGILYNVHPFQLLGILYNVKRFQLLGMLYNVKPFQLLAILYNVHHFQLLGLL